MYLTRTLESWFKEASRQFPVLLVTGARQVGKTTFLRRISEPERSYVTLDDPLVLVLAKSARSCSCSVFRHRHQFTTILDFTI
jgi:hypothetical protein